MADQEGPESQRARSGVDFPQFEGVNQESAPSAVSPHQSVELVNVEIAGGSIQARPGESKVTPSGTPLDDDVYGMWDLESYLETAGGGGGSGLRTVHIADQNNNTALPSNIYVTGGSAISTITGTTAPYYMSAGYWSAQNVVAFGTAKNASNEYEIRRYTANPAGLAEPTVIATIAAGGTASDNGITGMAEGSDGLLYVAVKDTGGGGGVNTKIYTVAASGTVTMVKDTGSTKAVYLTAFEPNAGNYMVATFEGSVPLLLWTVIGSGVWSSNGITGFGSTSNHNGATHVMTLGGDKVLVLGYYRTTGGSSASEMIGIMWPDPSTTWATHAFTTSYITAPIGIGGFAGIGDVLYVFCGDTHLGSRWISTFDTTNNWVDEAIDMTGLGISSPRGAAVIGEEEQVVLIDFAGEIFYSDGADMSQPWTDSGTAAFFARQFCVAVGP